jgi:hypothetical protein
MKPLEYIKQHNTPYYCEILVLPNGDIEKAVPSHTEALIKLHELSRDSLYKKIPPSASPLHWLIKDLHIVSVWNEFCLFNIPITKEQRTTLELLIDYKIVSFKKEELDDKYRDRREP